MQIDFATDPTRYRHWRLDTDWPVAILTLDVDPAGGLFPGTELKLNSYDLGVDIELADAVTRLRFEHPEVRAVVIRSGKPNVFCAGANIGALARASHAHKVNFCKFTNETRLAIEDASAHSGQRYLVAVNGTAAGGGYELALACDHIMLIDDRRSAVSLPEVPLLAVLPGRRRADPADRQAPGAPRPGRHILHHRGRRAWPARAGLAAGRRIGAAVFVGRAGARAGAGAAAGSDRPAGRHRAMRWAFRCRRSTARSRKTGSTIAMCGSRSTARRGARQSPCSARRNCPPISLASAPRAPRFWPLAMARELDDAILHLRFNEPELGLVVFRSRGRSGGGHRRRSICCERHADDWFVREVRLLLRRVFKRIDLTARSLFALIEPGSCFAGFLAELVFASDRAFMFAGTRAGDNSGAATLALSRGNFGAYPMGNGLEPACRPGFSASRTASTRAEARIGESLTAEDAEELGLVTAS